MRLIDDETTPTPVRTSPGELRRVLTLPALVFFGLVYMVPLTVFTTYGLVTVQTGGRLPTTYIVTLVAMIFTALSYGAMASAFPVAGSTFTYAKAAFGNHIGFLAGWSLLLDYLFLPMLNYLVIGIYLNAQAPSVAPWVFVVVSIAAVTALNVVGIASIAKANIAIIAAQAVFAVVFVAMGLATVSGTDVSLWEPFLGNGSYAAGGVDPSAGFGPLLAGASVLCLSFLGFDAVSTMAEETPDPRRDVPRAILWVTIGAGVLFTALAYVGHLVLREPRCLAAIDPACTFADTAALDVMARGGRACPEPVLRRSVRGGRVRIGAHLAGVGIAHPLRDGPRRRAAPRILRSARRALRHAGALDPARVGLVAARHVDLARAAGVDDQLRRARGVLGREPGRDQALPRGPKAGARAGTWSCTGCCHSSDAC